MKKAELLLQCEVVNYCRLLAAGIHPDWPGVSMPALGYIRASLNGLRMKPRQVTEMKASGMLVGEPDLFLSVARGGYAGLYVEMKTGGKRSNTSTDQKRVHTFLRSEGYLVTVHDSVVGAVSEIIAYMSAAPTWCRRSVS